jgi:PAS domain S-box-containing protein
MSTKPTYEELEQRINDLERKNAIRRQADESSPISEDKFQILVNTTSQGIQLTNLEGKIIFSNPAHHKIQGYPEGELIGKYVWEMPDEESEKIKTKSYYEMLIEDQPKPTPYFSLDRTKDGRLINIQVYWNYLRDKEGKLTGIISVISDITERKQIEEALKESEMNLKRVQQISKMGFWSHDLVNDEANWSDESFNLFGVDIERYPDRSVPVSEWLSILENPTETDALGKCLAEKNDHYEFEYRTIPINGIVKTMYSRSEVERDEKGSIIRIFGIDHDITEHKQVEKALTENRERLELALKGADLGMWDWVLETDSFIFNIRSEELLGYTSPSRSEDWFKRIHPDDLKRAKENVEVVIKGQSTIIDHDYRYISKTGEIKWIHSWGRVVEWSKDDIPLRATGTMHDITKEKKLRRPL